MHKILNIHVKFKPFQSLNLLLIEEGNKARGTKVLFPFVLYNSSFVAS